MAELTKGKEADNSNDAFSEQFKLKLQQDKLDIDNRMKQMQINETIRSNKKSEEFKQQEIDIKRKVANKPTTVKK